jgi:hypothetical protein
MFDDGISATPGYEIGKSLRLRASASAYLTRTVTAIPYTYTVSFWVKRATITSQQIIVGVRDAGIGSAGIIFTATDTIQLTLGNVVVGSTTAVFRDPGAWYHFVLSVTISGTAVLYANGVQVFSAAVGATPYLFRNGGAFVNAIGRNGDSATSYFDGYVAEFHYIDGQALTPASFGQTTALTGAWVPSEYGGSYGTTGFYLPFSDGTSLTTLGYDESGNNNDWTLNNVSITAGITYDWMSDTPTDNYATLNSLKNGGTLAGANLNYSSAATVNAFATFGMEAGKWYWEVTATSVNNAVGIALDSLSSATYPLTSALAWCYAGVNGNKYNGSAAAYGATYTTNDIIGVTFDAATGELTFYKNNASQGVAFTVPTGVPYFPIATTSTAGAISASYNFGQRPFTYTPPSGYVALSSKSISAPAVKRGDRHFEVTTYTGDGNDDRTILNASGLDPDLVWIKGRSGATGHVLMDTVRGDNYLSTNSTAVEGANSTFGWSGSGPTTGGFIVDDGTNGSINGNAATFAAWQWQESAGIFDIVTYTGTGANRTIAHSLGVAPSLVIVKRRSAIADWCVYHESLGALSRMLLSQNVVAAADATMWNSTAPTSSVFSVGTNVGVNANGDTYVAYLFADVDGYCKVGSYTGNASASGPFVWCGFKPKAVIIKCASTAALSWMMQDGERSEFNQVQKYFSADLAIAESDSSVGAVDFLSNGFRIRTTNGNWNSSGATMIFIAFAETPFKYSNAR